MDMARYVTVVAALGGFAVTGLLGFALIPLLRRLKFGQSINEIGPRWHKDKQGTPTMGGFLFIIGSSVGLLVAYPLLGGVISDLDPNATGVMMLAVFTSLAFGAVGFLDDYLKVVHKQNLGLRWWAKMLLQVLVTSSFLVTLRMMNRLSTRMQLPIIGSVDFGIFFYPISLVLIVFIVNAVNLTDGIDGLAASITFIVMCAFYVILGLDGRYQMSIWAAALAGSCVGFLVWNFFPAKVFMGDTGSLFLGGAISVTAYCMNRPELLFILGFMFIVEAVSVLMQVGWFKFTKWRTGEGKRIFKMSPIHHHFEMSGWSEYKIVAVFSFVTLVCAILAYLYVRLN